MGKLIIVTGFLATLKTTISKKLGDDLGLLCLNKDDIKEILGESILFSNREENLRLSSATFKVIKSIAFKTLSLGNNIIIEGNFKSKEIEELNDILNTKNNQIFTVFLRGNPDILYQRYIERQPSRNLVHTSTGLMSYEIFLSSMETYKKEDCLGEVVEYDTTIFDESKYMQLLGFIKRFLSDEKI